jgi:hypothetical protein
MPSFSHNDPQTLTYASPSQTQDGWYDESHQRRPAAESIKKQLDTGYRRLRKRGINVITYPKAPPRLLPGSGGIYSGGGEEFDRTHPLPPQMEALFTRGRPGGAPHWPDVSEEHRKFVFHDPTGTLPKPSAGQQHLFSRGAQHDSFVRYYDDLERARLAAAGRMPPPAPRSAFQSQPAVVGVGSIVSSAEEAEPRPKRQKTTVGTTKGDAISVSSTDSSYEGSSSDDEDE